MSAEPFVLGRHVTFGRLVENAVAVRPNEIGAPVNGIVSRCETLTPQHKDPRLVLGSEHDTAKATTFVRVSGGAFKNKLANAADEGWSVPSIRRWDSELPAVSHDTGSQSIQLSVSLPRGNGLNATAINPK